MSFSPDGKYLASGAGDNTVRIWDFKTSKELFIYFSADFLHPNGRGIKASFSIDTSKDNIISAKGDYWRFLGWKPKRDGGLKRLPLETFTY